MTRGQAGKTTLTDGRTQLPTEHYRVAKFAVAQPGDADGDRIDDITELNAPSTMNPLNPARSISFNDGTVMIPDQATFEALSYQGKEVAIDNHLSDLEFVKFYLLDVNTDRPSVYFMNTVTHRAHMRFANAVGIPAARGQQSGQMRGEIVYHRNVRAPMARSACTASNSNRTIRIRSRRCASAMSCWHRACRFSPTTSSTTRCPRPHSRCISESAHSTTRTVSGWCSRATSSVASTTCRSTLRSASGCCGS